MWWNACEILAGGGGQLGQVKSVDIKISFSKGVALFWSTHTHTHTHTHTQERLDKLRSALADARLKTRDTTYKIYHEKIRWPPIEVTVYTGSRLQRAI